MNHFKNLDTFLRIKAKAWLKKNGYLVMNEYVGPDRLQYSKNQLLTINEALKTIPKKFRKINSLPMHKNRISGVSIGHSLPDQDMFTMPFPLTRLALAERKLFLALPQ